MTSAAVDALSVGSVMGGLLADSRKFGDAAMSLASRVIELRDGVESPLRVNVVYIIAGEILPPLDIVGVRTGRYSSKDKHLLVEVAVSDLTRNDVDNVLVGLLSDAIDEAERFAHRKRITDQPLTSLRNLAHSLRKA